MRHAGPRLSRGPRPSRGSQPRPPPSRLACHNNPSTIGSLITPGIWPGVLNWDDTVDVRADRYGDWLVWAR
jgi:hypothetical protein